MDLIGALSGVAGAAGGEEPEGTWDLSTAVYNGSPVNLLYFAHLGTGAFFKSDGTKLYFLDSIKTIREWSLSTAYDLGTASFVQTQILSTGSATFGLFFRDNGLSMYLVDNGTDEILEYTLSTAWDITTASYTRAKSVATEETTPQGVWFKPDGTKMYVIGQVGDDVNEYSLSTAWNVSTASYVQNFSVSSQEIVPTAVTFNATGTKMYVLGLASRTVFEYALSTAWNISTASYTSSLVVGATFGNDTYTVLFNDNGEKLFVITSNTAIAAYELSTAYDLTTATFVTPTTNYVSVATDSTNPSDLAFKPDGTRMYVLSDSGDDVNEYSLSTAWDITTASYVQNFSVGAQEDRPQGLYFKPDGTKMYITGSRGDDVNEYDLSTAWNVSTASYVQVFSVAGQDTVPVAIFFKDDGTKMYVAGSTGADVNEYALSTAWDISSASFTQNRSVSPGFAPEGLYFKPDGTKMYVTSSSGMKVYQFDLATAWDISTMSFIQSINLNNFDSDVTGLFFRPNGKQMFITGSSRDSVYSFDLD